MNLLDQTPIPLSKVPDKVQEIAGFKPARTTIFRWKTRGCRGKKLATFRAGGRVCTTIEALLEFFSDGDEAPEVGQASSGSGSHSAVDAFLESEGI